MIASIKSYTVETRRTPGADMSVVAVRDVLSQARQAASEYARRKDLTYQDVVIYRGTERVEFAGPAR